MPDFAIQTKNLTRKFGNFTAVDGLTLNVYEGELFGFLGPNGAGKTTTIRMLTTLISPTAGDASIGGFDLRKESAKVRSVIGVVPQQFALFDELTPIENLQYIGRLYGMSEREISDKSRELLDITELWDKKDVAAGGFSGGMKQRLSVAAGLLHEPQILFMDEPTTGLDPHSRIALRELTARLNKEHDMTIIYTTHDMEEADKLCDRVGIMNLAKLIEVDTPEGLKRKISQKVRVEFHLVKGPKDLLAQLKRQPFVHSVEAKNSHVLLELVDKPNSVFRLNDFLSSEKTEFTDYIVREKSLEDVFISLTSGESE